MKKIPLYLLVILLLLPLAGCSEHTCDFTELVPDSRHYNMGCTYEPNADNESGIIYQIIYRDLYSCKCGNIASVPEKIDTHTYSSHYFISDAPVTGDYECAECHIAIHADFTGWEETEIVHEGGSFIQGMSPLIYENPEVGAAHKGKDDEYIKNYSELYLPQHKPAE